eukprot:tig00021127_g18756.t1
MSRRQLIQVFFVVIVAVYFLPRFMAAFARTRTAADGRALNDLMAPPDELPLYSDVEKWRNAAYTRFLSAFVSSSGGKSPSGEAFEHGWHYIRSGDVKNAVKMFNHAWILDPENPDVYRGFAASLNMKGMHDTALRFFAEAHVRSPLNTTVLIEFGRTYLLAARRRAMLERKEKPDGALLERAVICFRRALELNCTEPLLYFSYAEAVFFQEEYAEAWQWAAEAEQAAGTTLGDVFTSEGRQFVEALTKKLPRPAAVKPPKAPAKAAGALPVVVGRGLLEELGLPAGGRIRPPSPSDFEG